MKKTFGTQLFLLMLILAAAMIMSGCSSENEDDNFEGLLYNQTAYKVEVNFIGKQIITLASGDLLVNTELKENSTYSFQVTIFDNAGNPMQVIDSSITTNDSDDDDEEISGQKADWAITITEDGSSFTVLSVS